MKKYIALMGAMILVMALALPALAAEKWSDKFETSSLFQIWSVWVNKQDFKTNADEREDTTKGISSRINFFLQWGDPKYVRGTIGFEADSTNWGESAWDNSGTTANPSGRMGVRNTDQVQLEIKRAYLEFTIPNTPIIVTPGIQGFSYGGRLLQSIDTPGLKVTANFAPHKIEAAWLRYNETSRTTYGVNDIYGLIYDLKQKEFNVNAFGFYENDLSNDGYANHPFWIGIRGGFRPGNLNLSGAFVYVGGKRDNVATDDVDYTAWAAELLGEYKIGPGLSAAAEFFYATGNDANDATKGKQYFRPAGSESHSNFGLGRTVFFFMNFSQFGNQHNKQSDFGGMWYGRLNAIYSPLPWIQMSGNYLYLGDTSSGDPANVATGGNINSPSGAQQVTDKSFIGHEINLITTLRIYQNFTYNIGLGYFIPGDVYDRYDSITGDKTKSADSAWAINTGMQLAF